MRILLVKLFFLVMFVAITLRLFYWQVVKADFLVAKAEGQRVKSVKLTALRGNIFFSDGSTLASTKPTFLLYGQPKVMVEDQKLNNARLLSRAILGVEALEPEVEEKAKKLRELLVKDLFWVPLEREIDTEVKKRIDGLKITGIGFEEGSSRLYPEGSSSANLLGFVGSDAKGEDTGYFGLEGFYNGELKGISGTFQQEKDALGLPILIGNLLSSKAKNGKDLKLNIDRVVQYIVENSLKKGIEKYGAKSASAVIMDSKTGAIIALASYPNYDPAKFSDFPKEYYRNSVVADSYEPGSTFKVLVMASAINENVVTPGTHCDSCSGPVDIGGFSIRTWNNQYMSNPTMTDVIIHSDNTGMVFASKKLGLDKMYEYISNFGFGTPTNIDLQDETVPLIRPKNNWREIDLATASFGQGIAVTPIQMIRAVATIANGGFLVEPEIVSQVIDNHNDFVIKPKIVKSVISENTAKQVSEMMVKAAEEGEAKYLKIPGYKVAGKTGTAQIPVAGHYDANKTIASFVGFAPADNPKFVMLVKYDEPSSSIFGAETAAPTFFEIAKQLFTYYKIPPTE